MKGRNGPTGFRRPAAFAAAAASLLLLVAGCSNPLPGSVAKAPVLEVTTALYPLAEAAQLIGQNKVRVSDVVPDGANPFTYAPSAAQITAIRHAGLVLEIGGGFQTSFETAATGAPAVASLRTVAPPGGSPYVWLDPATMRRAVNAAAAAMEKADPAAAALFRRNATSLDAEISSLGIDYSSTLSACPGTVLVTPDNAFATMAASYGRRTIVMGPAPSAAQVTAAARTVQQVTSTPVIAEPWVDDDGVSAVATAAHISLRTLDTLAGVPAGGWPSGGNYFSLMEQNLGTLSSLLGCGPAQ